MQLNSNDFSLTKNSFGKLILKQINSSIAAELVTPIRAFPLSARNELIYLVNEKGHELAYIDKLSTLEDDFRKLIVEDFAGRELIPIIKRIKTINRYEAPCIFTVVTDKGTTELNLTDESNIRQFNTHSFLITDCNGVNFLIKNYLELDKHSKHILERFI